MTLQKKVCKSYDFSSKTSLKEMVDEEEQAADGDEDDESETSNDENMFVIEVDKVILKIQVFTIHRIC
jgi:hypothetical protein